MIRFFKFIKFYIGFSVLMGVTLSHFTKACNPGTCEVCDSISSTYKSDASMSSKGEPKEVHLRLPINQSNLACPSLPAARSLILRDKSLLISTSEWQVILNHLPDSEQALLRTSKLMNSIVQTHRLRNKSKDPNFTHSSRKWGDLNDNTNIIQAHLHDHNFWQGFHAFMKAIGIWSTSGGLPPYGVPVSGNRSKVGFYLDRIQKGTIAHRILDEAYTFLITSSPAGLQNACKSKELNQQADAGYSSAQDLLSLCHLHVLNENAQRMVHARYYASLASTSNLPFHPSSNYSSQKLRYIELVEKASGPFTLALTPIYREIFSNIFSDIELKRSLIQKIRATGDVALTTEFNEKLLLDSAATLNDRREYAFSLYNTKNYVRASELYEKIVLSPDATLREKRACASCQNQIKNYARSAELFEQILLDPDATLNDKRNCACNHYYTKNYARASELYEKVILDPDAHLSDIRDCAVSQFQSKNDARISELYEKILLDPNATLDDKRRCARSQYRTNNYARSAELYEKILLDPSARHIDKRNCVQSQYDNKNHARVAELCEKILLDPNAPLDDKRYCETLQQSMPKQMVTL